MADQQENPDSVPCPRCNGDGRVWGGVDGHATHRQDCNVCLGSGRIPENPDSVELNVLRLVVRAWAAHLDQLVMDTPEDQALVADLRALLPAKYEPEDDR